MGVNYGEITEKYFYQEGVDLFDALADELEEAIDTAVYYCKLAHEKKQFDTAAEYGWELKNLVEVALKVYQDALSTINALFHYRAPGILQYLQDLYDAHKHLVSARYFPADVPVYFLEKYGAHDEEEEFNIDDYCL